MLTFTINGTGFLQNDMLPQVTFTSVANPATMVTVLASSANGCTDQQCTQLTVSATPAQLPDGQYNVVI